MFLNLKSLNKQQDIFFMLRSHLSDFWGWSLYVVKARHLATITPSKSIK